MWQRVKVGLDMPSNLPNRCPGCGVHYRAFRSGYTWQDAFDQLFCPGRPKEDWVNIRTKTVQGRLWEIKQAQWAEHIEQCRGGLDMSKVEEY